MSNCLTNDNAGNSVLRAELKSPVVVHHASTQGGVGMLEFLVALLIFSTGMMGLLTAQLVGKKTSFEASQRSIATSLARDILERIRANPGQISAYEVESIGSEANSLQLPEADCNTVSCSTAQLAAFDLWQWESLLRGMSEQDAKGSAGGLLSPRACITSSGAEVEVTISWLGILSAEPATGDDCPEAAVDDLPLGEEDDRAMRHQLTLSTFVPKP